MRWMLTLITILATGLLTIDAKPAPKIVPKPPEAKTLPDYAAMVGVSNWGTATQEGRVIFLTGHPRWEATGEIRADGSILLAWTLIETGQVCPGVYRLEGKDLVGTWGYADAVTIEVDGTLSGETRPDRIYRLPLPVAPIN